VHRWGALSRHSTQEMLTCRTRSTLVQENSSVLLVHTLIDEATTPTFIPTSPVVLLLSNKELRTEKWTAPTKINPSETPMAKNLFSRWSVGKPIRSSGTWRQGTEDLRLFNQPSANLSIHLPISRLTRDAYKSVTNL
jgi:hypothetical protein